MAKLNVEVILGLVDRLSKPLQGLQRNLDRALNAAGNLALSGGALSDTGQKILAPLQGAVAAFADAEDASTRFKLSMMTSTGAVLPAYHELNGLAQRLGDRLPGSTADFVGMMTMLRRQGMDATTILAGTGEAAANLAVMLQMPAAAAAEFSAKLQDATGTSAADMLALTDTIQRTFNVGVDPGNMLDAFSALSPGMDAIKQKGLAGANAMAPLLAMLDQASLSGGAAGNALRKVFQGSFGGSEKSDKALDRYNLDFVDDAGEFRGLDNLFAQLAKLRKLSTEQRLGVMKDIWGDDSETLQALNVMVEKGAAGYAEMTSKLSDQADMNQRMIVLLGTLKNLWDAATGTVSNLAARIGELLAPQIKQAVDWLGAAAARAREWIDANPQLAKTIALVVAGLGAFAVVGGGMMIALAGILGGVSMLAVALAPAVRLLGLLLTPLRLLVPAFAMAGRAAQLTGMVFLLAGRSVQIGMLPALRALPGALAAKVAALRAATIASLAWARANLLTITGLRGLLGAAGGALLGALRALGSGLRGAMLAARGLSLALLTNPITWVVAAMIGAAALIIKYWEPIKGFFSGVWSGLVAGLAPISGAFSGAFGGVMPYIQPIIDGLQWVWDKLVGLLGPVDDTGGAAEAMGRRWGQAIAGMILKIGELLGGLLALPGKMFQIGSDIVQGLWNGWLSKWESFKAWVSGLGDVIPNWLKSPLKVQSPSRVFAEIGANLVAGLQVGMTQTIPALLKDMGALAGKLAAVPLLAAPLTMAPAQATVERMPAAPVAATARAAVERLPGAAHTQPAERLRTLMADDPASKARDERRLGWLRDARARVAEPAPQRIAAAQAASGRRGAGRGEVSMPISVSITAPSGADPRQLAALVRDEVSKAGREVGRRMAGALYDQPDDM